jgi:hypothetical protein
MQFVKMITMGVVGGTVGTVLLLAFLTISQPVPIAQATPAIGKGQPCKTCHTSSKPSKSDLKK